ncbi:MAG: haloacid dehalogenase [Candidatus Hermodarchaeota archaeon]|nr:haloacid dehalogenase [Candidatus Hermodarchaeota archaeon]
MDLEEISKIIYTKLASQNEARDFLINEMHEALKATREAIAAIHRNEIATAKESIKNAQSMIKRAQTHLKKLSQLPVVNLVHDAEGELAEAALFLAFRQNEPLPSPDKIGVKEIGYLQGLGDLVGELRRYSIDSLTNDDIEEAKRAFSQMETIYAILMTFDFPRGLTPGIRKKTDIARGIIERTRADLSTAIENRRLLTGIASLRKTLGK